MIRQNAMRGQAPTSAIDFLRFTGQYRPNPYGCGGHIGASEIPWPYMKGAAYGKVQSNAELHVRGTVGSVDPDGGIVVLGKQPDAGAASAIDGSVAAERTGVEGGDAANFVQDGRDAPDRAGEVDRLDPYVDGVFETPISQAEKEFGS